MSMLAEPRRKVRYNINPNGNTWANDTNAFGKKMLEKMGWSSGKGLGANLDGMTSHVKVKHKSDQQGVGFKDRNDQWTEHEDKFSELLQNLQSNGHTVIDESNEPGNKSLELKSKVSRTRVHYKKFTRGKDLSRYSNKDLANIFGRTDLEKKSKKREENEEIEECKKEDDEYGKTFGVETLHGGSMADYFKKKMGQFKASLDNKISVQSEVNSDDDYDARPSFGFGFTPRGEDIVQETNLQVGKKEKKRKLKSLDVLEEPKMKKVKNGVSNPGFEIPEDNCDSGVSIDENDGEIVENLYEVKPVKKQKKKKENDYDFKVDFVHNQVEEDKSKKKKKKKDKDACTGIENVNFNLSTASEAETTQESVNPYELVVKEKKKKKNKKKSVAEEEGVDNPNFNVSTASEELETTQERLNPYEIIPKTKKNKQKDKQGIENPNLEITPIKKKKKEKRRSLEDSFTIEELPETPEVPTSSEIKKKKKKSKKECSEVEEEIDFQVSTPPETKLTKKQRKHSLSSTETNEIQEEVVVSSSQPPSPKTPTPSNNFGISEDLIMNITSFEVKPILHTPQSLNAKTKRRKSVRIDESLNQERIIPNVLQQKQLERENLQERNELFDINAGIIERSLEEHRKQEINAGIANEAFDVQSVDQKSFHNKNFEVMNPHKDKPHGIINPAFSNKQEGVENVRKHLDNFQAEVENDINEEKQILETKFIGSKAELEQNKLLSNGHIQLAFKQAKLTEKLRPYDFKVKSIAKRGYKHLVKGDIEIEMKGSNLHQLPGYATLESFKKNPQVDETPKSEVVLTMPLESYDALEKLKKVQMKLENKHFARQIKQSRFANMRYFKKVGNNS